MRIQNTKHALVALSLCAAGSAGGCADDQGDQDTGTGMEAVSTATSTTGTGGTEGDQTTTGDATTGVEEVDCWYTEIIGAGGRCYTAEVAIDPQKPHRGTLRQGFVHLPAVQASGQAPVVALIGGPGPSGSLLVTPEVLGGGLSVLREQRDVYIVDYRLVGLSEPQIDCALGMHRPGADDSQDCQAALFEAGLSFADIGSDRFAADIAATLSALAIDRVVLWGGSYGTRVALTLMRDAPELVESAILDGVFPPEVNGFTHNDDGLASQLAHLVQRCRELPACQQRLGDLGAAMEAFVTHRPNALARDYIIQLARWNRHPAAPLLVHHLQNLGDNEAAQLLAELDALSHDDLPDPPQLQPVREDAFDRIESLVMMLGIACREEAGFADQQPGNLAQFGLAAAVLDTLAGLGGGAPMSLEQASMLCSAMSAGVAEDHEMAAVHSSIPTLMLSGGQDNATPLIWAEQAAQGLSRAQHFVLDPVGHITMRAHSCAQDLARQFLHDPQAPLNSACTRAWQGTLVLESDDLLAEFMPANGQG